MKRAMYAIPAVGLIWGCGGVNDAPAICGNASVEEGEECDDGNQDDTDDCPTSCLTARCNDGFVQFGAEDCDDANNNDQDACTNDCNAAQCGDDITFDEAGGDEECDDGNNVDGDSCTASCTEAVCGDGVVFNIGGGNETCDDANAVETDGCQSNCQLDPVLQNFEITNHRGVPATDVASYNLCTAYGGYGGCYGFTACSTNFASPVTMSMALMASGSYSRTRDCADNNFDTLVTKTITGTVEILVARQQYRITLTEDTDAVVLDCTMDVTSKLSCTDAAAKVWTLEPQP